mgnify:CR=1 FL=1
MAVTAERNRESYIRDSFINGLQSKVIRQRFLENKTLDLETALDLIKPESYQNSAAPFNAAIHPSDNCQSINVLIVVILNTPHINVHQKMLPAIIVVELDIL